MTRLTVSSCAKINLGLRVLGRRDDGYHDLMTILQTVDLSDEILMEEDRVLSLSVKGRYRVPSDESNLVLRAARALAELYPGRGARITLRKSIPPGAGLGGGSSNAAATLLGLDRLWGLQIDPGIQYGIARRIGMDVPFFLYGGTCLAVGRGDEVMPLPDGGDWSVVVVWPGTPLSTKEVYADLPFPLTRPRILSSIKGFVPDPPGPDTSSARERGGSAGGTPSGKRTKPRPPEVANDLEETAFGKVPVLRRLKERLISSGATVAAMTGSGSAVFGLFSTPQGAGRAAASLTSGEMVAFSCRTLSRDAYRLNLIKRSQT